MNRAELTRRDRVAELLLLDLYDHRRSRAGHDYGSGQRHAELSRRSRELGELTADDRPSLDELRAAFDRVGRPRLGRRSYATQSGMRTLREWERLRDELAAGAVDVYVAGDVVEVLGGVFRGRGVVIRPAVVVVESAAPAFRRRDRDTVELRVGSQIVAAFAELVERVDGAELDELEQGELERCSCVPTWVVHVLCPVHGLASARAEAAELGVDLAVVAARRDEADDEVDRLLAIGREVDHERRAGRRGDVLYHGRERLRKACEGASDAALRRLVDRHPIGEAARRAQLVLDVRAAAEVRA